MNDAPTTNPDSTSLAHTPWPPRTHSALWRLCLLLALGGGVPLAFAQPAPNTTTPEPADTPEPVTPVVEEGTSSAAEAAPAPMTPAATPPPPVATASAPTGPPAVVKAGAEGFSLQSADGDFVLKLRGYVQADGRFFLSEQERRLPSTFLLRRVRPIIEGTLFGRFDYRVMTDFGGGTATVFDAHVDARIVGKSLQLRAGKFKPPVGLERLQSGTALLFIERALPTSLVPNRDVGVQLQGQLAGGVLHYAVGFFNGVPDGGSSDVDNEDNKDLVARVFAHPFKKAPVKALQGLGLGIAGSRGELGGTPAAPGLPQLRSTGQQTFFTFRTGPTGAATAADTVVARGTHTRLSPQGYFYAGPVGLIAEYVNSAQRVGIGDDVAKLRFVSWQVAGSFVLGGDASYEGVKPRTWVSNESTGWGALELALRYSDLRVPAAAFPLYADPSRSAHRARATGANLNWYLNRNAKASLQLERTAFDGGAPAGGNRPIELALLSRFQLSW